MEEKPCSSSAADRWVDIWNEQFYYCLFQKRNWGSLHSHIRELCSSADVTEEAKKLIGTGNRHLVMGDVVSAVSVFQEACGMLWVMKGDHTYIMMDGERVIHSKYTRYFLISVLWCVNLKQFSLVKSREIWRHCWWMWRSFFPVWEGPSGACQVFVLIGV